MTTPDTRQNIVAPSQAGQAPQGPLDAFESFAALIRDSSDPFERDPDVFLAHLRPFLQNPPRTQHHVKEIIDSYSMATLYPLISRFYEKVPFFGQWFLRRLLTPYLEQKRKRITELTDTLREDLQPGAVRIHVKPIRALGVPSGFDQKYRAYLVQVQILVEDTPDDSIVSVDVGFQLGADGNDISIDVLTPGPAFSEVQRKDVAETQMGLSHNQSMTKSVDGGLSGGIAKLSGGVELAKSTTGSLSVSGGVEQSTSSAEQYLAARMLGPRATWNVLAGIGAIDVAANEYAAQFKAPADVKDIELQVDVTVTWFRLGQIPAAVRDVVVLPEPDGDA